MEAIQKEANELSEKFQKSQQSMSSLDANIQQLTVTINENQAVKQELEALTDDQKVYKIVGPVLVRVERSEAISNVENRLNLLQRQQEDLAEKAKKESDNYKALENEFVKLQQRAALAQVESLPQQK